MIRTSNRRQFLQASAAAGIGFWAAGGLSAQQSRSPNERIRFACVGIDGKGASDSDDAHAHGDIVAICDIDDAKLDAASKRFEGARKYNDFRRMFDDMGSAIDAVTVSTPDHCHAVVAAAAMQMGKHCFCQKPLTHTLWEARRLAEIARAQKVATQMGNQGTASDSLRRAAAIIQSGALGQVTHVHVWSDRPIWPQGVKRPDASKAPPAVHWEEWLGPAPYRPYGEGYHPFSWRGWWDFGTGALGDMACHLVNMPYMALGLRDPVCAQARTSGHNRDSFPKWSVIDFDFAASRKRAGLKLTWYDGGQKPPGDLVKSADPARGRCLVIGDAEKYARDFREGKHPTESGCLVIGEKGNLYSAGRAIVLTGGVDEPNVDWVHSPGHFEEWIRAIRGGEPATSNFPDYAGPLTETVLVGNLAVWMAAEADGPGKKVEWDAEGLAATNAPELAALIKPAYRDGYRLAGSA